MALVLAGEHVRLPGPPSRPVVPGLSLPGQALLRFRVIHR